MLHSIVYYMLNAVIQHRYRDLWHPIWLPSIYTSKKCNHISSGDIYQQAAQARDIERVAGMYYVRMR